MALVPREGPIDGLEGNEEYLNGHPSSSSQGLPAATASETQPAAAAPAISPAPARTPRTAPGAVKAQSQPPSETSGPVFLALSES
ncbi:hypothetical protein AK812_SmicGene42768 [Symbiodinium microadriaticum]|uniref:Uncharacterized protein n=1 Tax=Symbiodinium microadriaticum TaxID=2951 RepID=A0A1Q9C2R4_SYMMI|nr:hypothetical protein AK812_SmicGene42768 [Symbiodinium microadriaticum]